MTTDDDDLRAVQADLIDVGRSRSVALSDALVTAGQQDRAAAFIHQAAERLAPCAWSLGPAATDLLADLAAAQVRAGDDTGAQATASFAAVVASTLSSAFALPAPFGSPFGDETNTVTAVIDTVRELIRDAAVSPADFARAAQPALDYARRPWQARARTLAALTQALPDERARLTGLLGQEQQRIWELATATYVPGAVLDADDAAIALSVLASALAGAGEAVTAREAIDRAGNLAAEVTDPYHRARVRYEVVRGLSAVGEHAAALRAAGEIGHPAYQGHAEAEAIAAAAQASTETDLVSAALAITDPGWRAVALVAVDLATDGPPQYDAKAQDLIREVVHGDPSTRVWQEVIELYVTAGQYEAAVNVADKLTDNAAQYLAVLAAVLGRRAAEDDTARAAAGAALLRLLPRCARYPEAGYAACVGLALAFPADAAEVAEVVADHADAVTAATGGRNRG